MRIQIGELRTPIVIEGLTRTKDGAGGFTETWATVLTSWGKVVPNTGAAAGLLGERERAIASHVVMLRWDPLLAVGQRVKVGTSQYLAVRGVSNVQIAGEYAVLACEDAGT